ncbi:AraC family transcriptional regulator [Tamaricihabitans halophyticus]|uniref:AraC family transcriptional regulator n=1 Tax=Tamaricihabitans halophyticus TaxID=1262583 RepID=A0A4V2SUC5_9PSEU|nr:AraC family transcriptional regulator [Tamaricihabitans halophyticus]TCP53976.1 AraC family transcriptional regulator [Tamaricihabitans halophyticus]
MPNQSYVVDSHATVEVPRRERTAYWAHQVASLQAALELRAPRTGDFQGGYSRIGTEHYQLVAWQADEAEYVRGVQHVRTAPDDNFRFLFPLDNLFMLRHHDAVTGLRPGMAGVFAYDKPFTAWHDDDTKMMVLTVQGEEIENRIGQSARPGAPLDVSKGLGRVAQELAAGLLRERDELTRDQFESAAERLVELLCMQLMRDNQTTTPAALGEIDVMARRYIRQHVDERDLTGATVAQALGWSLRQVQLALQQTGTSPRELIREERLKAARERLRDPAYQHLSIAEIAAQLGFSAPGNFSSAFRHRFGERPRDLRG